MKESMSNNTKKSSSKIASLAAQTLNNPNSSGIQKKLAGSAITKLI